MTDRRITWMTIPTIIPGDWLDVGDGKFAIVTWKSRVRMTAVKPTGFVWLDSLVVAFYRKRWQIWQSILGSSPGGKT